MTSRRAHHRVFGLWQSAVLAVLLGCHGGGARSDAGGSGGVMATGGVTAAGGSAYVFNPGANLGSAADWQPATGLIEAGAWYHVVGEYTLKSAPADCQNTAMYPGAIDIWVNGVKWDHASHGQTGCMSQYQVVPVAGSSPLNIGTMTMDTWFAGSVGKVAVYDRLLSPDEVAKHYRAMTGRNPTGTCADDCTF